MDYDENDFQSQNLHLAGEGSNKYPPVLRPYALPKFDFDDSLHAHLRFDDSLVEAEVFLGIGSNEDNQWIEDFSRGSSGIVFSSSATESCAISRHNNVWSEATSSESVEMLLKSVGQDEKIPEQNIAKDSDACDELGCIIKQMEPSLKRDESSVLKASEENLQPTLLLDDTLGKFSGLKDDIVGGDPLVKDVSQTCEGDSTADGGFSNPAPCIAGGKENIMLIKGNEFGDVKCAGVGEREAETLVTEHLGNRMQGDSPASSIQIENQVSLMQNISSGTEMNNQDLHLQKPTESSQNDSGENQEECLVSLDSRIHDGSTDGNLDAESTPQLCSLDTKVDGKINAPLDVALKGVSDDPMTEGCSEGVYSSTLAQISEHNVAVLSQNTETGDQVEENSNKGSSGALGPEVEVSNISAGICFNVELNTDKSIQATCGPSSFEKATSQMHSQVSTEIVNNKPEAPLLSLEDSKYSYCEVDGSSNSHEGVSSILKIVSSSAELQQTHAAGISEGLCNVSTGCRSESATSNKNNIEENDVNHCNQDVSAVAKEASEVPCDGRKMDSESCSSMPTDKGITSEFSGASGVYSVNEFKVSVSCSDAAACLKSADNVALPPDDGASVGAVIDQQEVRMSPIPGVGLLASNREESTAAMSSEAGLSNLKTSSTEMTVVDLVYESKKGSSHDTGEHLLCEKVDQFPSLMHICIKGNQVEPQEIQLDQVCKDSTLEIDLCPSGGGLTQREAVHADGQVNNGEVTVKENDEKEALSKVPDAEPTMEKKDDLPWKPIPLVSEKPCDDSGQRGQEDDSGDKNHVKIATPSTKSDTCVVGGSFNSTPVLESPIKSHVLESVHHGTDFDNPSCASPTIIKTSNPSQSETHMEAVKVPSDQNAPVPKVIDSQEPKGSDTSDGDKSFSFEVTPLADLTEKESGKSWQPFATVHSGKISTIVGAPPSTSGLEKANAKTSQDVSRGGIQMSDREITRTGSKGTPERKTRRSSGKGKESGKKGNAAKETTPIRQSQSGERTSNVSVSPAGIVQVVQPNEMQHHGHIDASSNKPFGILTTSASSLPDLNTSAASSIIFQQPFTDLQQVQLRAQIFVYGALIQGTAPDEAYMISAFGGPDGGKSMWENAWRACIERLHNQKSHPVNPETPLQSRPGARLSDQAIKQNSMQSKVSPSPAGRASGKNTSVVNPIAPLSSPIWSISTPCDSLQSTGMPRGVLTDYQPTLSGLHPHQTPPVKNFGHGTSWLSPASFHSPWVASPQTSAFDTGARFSVLPITETVQLTSVKEASVSQSSGVKHVSQGPPVQGGNPVAVIAGTPLIEANKVTATPGQHSADPKPRKRKKIPVSVGPGQIIFHSQSQAELASVPAVTGHLSTSVSITTPSNTVFKTSSDKLATSLSPSLHTGHLRKGEREAEPRALLPEETLVNLKEVRIQAEEAAALAAVAVGRSQELWTEIGKRKNSGLESDVETRLSSAAVAIAAAAAVAKAAAAAANVASSAALQAKMMADEALFSSANGTFGQGNGISSSDSVRKMGQATPASILKGEDAVNSSNSVIVAAREAARRRVEAATAASKRAENIDAIVKAAELAAEAVSQAGRIVAMGDPLPLSQLVEAGPDGYWKVSHIPPEQVGKSNKSTKDQMNMLSGGQGPDTWAKHSQEVSLGKKETWASNHGTRAIYKELEDNVKLVDDFSGSVDSVKNIKGQKGSKTSDFAKAVLVVSESERGLISASVSHFGNEKATETSKVNDIREGSHVEVFKDGLRFKTAWYSADVLTLKEGKAFVCYAELLSDGGVDKLKEWVLLEGEGDRAPKIRLSRPTTAMPFEGTRKRRRANMGDYTWSIGDRVDAWIQDSWWEGTITEKGKKDQTTFTVHFPAQGETSAVRAWHLRPSLLWKDGKWIEWSSLRENIISSSHEEGDTPHEKRPRLGSPAGEIKGNDKILKDDILESGKPHEPVLLELSVSEKKFNIGKNTRNESKPDSLRMRRTGLQKEGSRVVFGVPKPGKKRKFMEVSKHYVADQNSKVSEPSDSVKFTKYLMPQGPGSRGWKNTSKSEPKEKHAAVSRPKVLKSGKVPSVSGKTIPRKDDLLSDAVASEDDSVSDLAANINDSASNLESTSGRNNLLEFQSFSSTDGAAEGPNIFSSVGASADAPSKKISTSNIKSERASKGKLAPAGGRLAKIEEDKIFTSNSAKSSHEVIEPRRSNRRIQPTSRLLEGLQSSLIISKIPSVSHDRGHKSQGRSASRGNNHS